MRELLGRYCWGLLLVFSALCTEITADIVNKLPLSQLYDEHCSSVVKVKYNKEGSQKFASGFFVSASGHVLAPVIGGDDFSVELVSRQRCSAKLLAEDKRCSIALLKVDLGPTKVSFFSLMKSGEWPKIGQSVVSLACRLGLNVSPQKGYITGFNSQCFGSDFPMTLVRTSLTMGGGDGGGVVLDRYGALQGMLLHAIAGAQETFFMPLCGLCRVFQDLLVFGRVRYCYVGLNTEAVFDNKQKEVVLRVREVVPLSPASKANFKVGDILRYVNGEKIDSVEYFKNFLFLSSPGDVCMVEIERDGKCQVLRLILEEKK